MKNTLLLLIGIILSLNICTTIVNAVPDDITNTTNTGINIPFEGDDVNLMSASNDNEENTTVKGGRDDGTLEINNAILDIVNWIRGMLGIFAILFITFYGVKMVIAREEADFTNAKKSIGIILGVLIISFLIEPVIRNVIYGGGDNLIAGDAILNPTESVKHGINEIKGLLNFLKTFIGFLAVIMIIITGVKSMFSFGDEDGISKQKENIKWVVIGVLLITFNEILINFGVYGTPSLNDNKVTTSRDALKIITEATGFIGFILSFVALVSFLGIIYGGFLMLGPNSDDTQKDTGKRIIKFVATGLVIIFISYTIISTLIMFNT